MSGRWNPFRGEWFERKHAVVFSCIIALQFMKNGFQIQPNFDVAVTNIALDPFQSFENYPGGARYVTTSWFMPALLYVLGVRSETTMILLHVLVAVSFYVVTYMNVKRFIPKDSRLKAVVIIGLLPVMGAPLNWLGYDTVVLLLISLLIATCRWPILVFIISTALGMQHFEIAAIALTSWFLVSRGLVNECALTRFRFITVSAIGVVAGRFVVALIHARNNVPSDGDRLDIARQIYKKAFADFVVSPFSILWSITGVSALFIVLILVKKKSLVRWLILGLGLTWLIAGSTLDSSRVGMVSASLALMGLVFATPHSLELVGRKVLVMMLLLFVLVPRVWMWEGANQPSCFAANTWVVASHIFDLDQLTASECRLYWVNN